MGSKSQKTIVCIGTLDTKGSEIQYVKNIIEQRGHRVLVIDDGILGAPTVSANISRKDVAMAAGSTLEQIIGTGSEIKAIETMTEGLCKIVNDLYQSGSLDGVISVGGGMGSSMATAAMRQLPLGVPKLMVSTKVAQSGVAKVYMGAKDITMVSSVADIAGLNRLTKKIAANAAGAIVGMVESLEVEIGDHPLVVMSMNGTTTKCGSKVMSILEGEKYEVVVFHSIGVGGRALEEFVRNESVKGVIEIGLNEIGNELFGGLAKAGADRLEAAGEKGVLQIITLGSVDFINFLGPETVPPQYKDRNLFYHNPQATTLRLNSDEMRLVAKVMAEKLNRANGPVKILIPTRGFSSWDREGKSFYDPDADKIFIDSLKGGLKPSIMISEIDAHINDEAFAEVIVEAFCTSARGAEMTVGSTKGG